MWEAVATGTFSNPHEPRICVISILPLCSTVYLCLQIYSVHLALSMFIDPFQDPLQLVTTKNTALPTAHILLHCVADCLTCKEFQPALVQCRGCQTGQWSRKSEVVLQYWKHYSYPVRLADFWAAADANVDLLWEGNTVPWLKSSADKFKPSTIHSLFIEEKHDHVIHYVLCFT